VGLSGDLPEQLLPFALTLPLLVGIVAVVQGRLAPERSPHRTAAGVALVLLSLAPALGVRLWLDLLASDSLGWVAPGGLGPALLRIGSQGRLSVGLLVAGAGLATARLPALRPWGAPLAWVGAGACVDALALRPAVLVAVDGVHGHPLWLSVFGAHSTSLVLGLLGLAAQRRWTALGPALVAWATAAGGVSALARTAAPPPVAGLPALPPDLRFGAPDLDQALADAPTRGPLEPVDRWPCIDGRPDVPWPERLRAGARVPLAADASLESLGRAAAALRSRSIYQLGLQGTATPAPPPGLARHLLSYPVLTLLLDRPPPGTWWLRDGPPPSPVETCGVELPPTGTLGPWVAELLHHEAQGCGSFALAPAGQTDPESCPAGK
jgi:hypothetical protein